MPHHTLSPLCKLPLASHDFPQLETVSLASSRHHEAFFVIWRDPLGDLLSLTSLAERGVKVDFGTQHVVQWFYFRQVRERMVISWRELRWREVVWRWV